jgi:hypothetical protein
LTWGRNIDFLLAEKARGGDPPALRNRVRLSPVESYFRDVFRALSRSRTITEKGFPRPLPISEILSYCQLFHIDRLDARETLLTYVQEQDAKYIEVVSQQVAEQITAAAAANKT